MYITGSSERIRHGNLDATTKRCNTSRAKEATQLLAEAHLTKKLKTATQGDYGDILKMIEEVKILKFLDKNPRILGLA